MLRKLASTSATWATVPIRLALGGTFIAHGAQKVLGKFGGQGWAWWLSQSQMVPFPFMRPTWLWLAAAGLAELVGGILVLLGLFTRLGALLIICVMITAIKVLWPAFFPPAGSELAVVMLAMALSLLISGGGLVSADRLIGMKK